MNKIYHLSTCSTCKKILSSLDLTGITLQDIKTKPITKNQLNKLREMTDSFESLFSKRAMKYKSLGLANKQLSEDDYKQYLLSDYTFLKRPVAVIEESIFIGNSKKSAAALKAKLTDMK
jgi:arsenate reductase (glutaredoxin)